MYCSKCGKEISDNSNYCNYCGNNMNRSNYSKAIIICIVITIIAITTCVGICFWKNNPKAEPVEEETITINGEYNSRLAAIELEGAGTSYDVYVFDNGKVEYTEEYVVYIGTYTIANDKVLIEYKYTKEMDETLYPYNQVDILTIKDENTLVNHYGLTFRKEN